jgi:hypothetical protein
MKKLTMKNTRAKLANARKLCPGMSKDFYLLTDYMSMNSKDELNPMDVGMLVFLIQDDLEKGRRGFNPGPKELPKELMERRKFVKNEIVWVPQLIDAIADDEFATEFRSIWGQFFGPVPPKRINTAAVNTDETYPEYVKVAIDWWANAIQSPKMDNGLDIPMKFSFAMVRAVKEYTPEEIKIFKEALAKGIFDDMEKFGRCHIGVDYGPMGSLSIAGQLIGIDSSMGYPIKTYMFITEKEVTVRAGDGAETEVIWKA